MDDTDFILNIEMESPTLTLAGVSLWSWWIVGTVATVEAGGWGAGVDENFTHPSCVVWLEYKTRISIIEYLSIYLLVHVLNQQYAMWSHLQ